MHDMYDIIIQSAMEHALSAYLTKECNKGLGREFGAQETDKNLQQEESARLKARVT